MAKQTEIDPARLPALVDALPGIHSLREAASSAPAYLVGGAVRDLLLGSEDTFDLDVVVEGGAEVLADLPEFTPERDSLFLTGKLALGDSVVDVAQARAESYPQPGPLPEVRQASITDDLARRDFTVNAMAFPLSSNRELIDPHGGVEDLRTGLLRVLH